MNPDDFVYYLPAINAGASYRDWKVIEHRPRGRILVQRVSDDIIMVKPTDLFIPESAIDRLARLA